MYGISIIARVLRFQVHYYIESIYMLIQSNNIALDALNALISIFKNDILLVMHIVSRCKPGAAHLPWQGCLPCLHLVAR